MWVMCQPGTPGGTACDTVTTEHALHNPFIHSRLPRCPPGGRSRLLSDYTPTPWPFSSLATGHSAFQGSPSGKHFAVPVGFSAGLPSPLGPSLVSVKEVKGVARATVNFAVSG
jgi:hypothetical protein